MWLFSVAYLLISSAFLKHCICTLFPLWLLLLISYFTCNCFVYALTDYCRYRLFLLLLSFNLPILALCVDNFLSLLYHWHLVRANQLHHSEIPIIIIWPKFLKNYTVCTFFFISIPPQFTTSLVVQMVKYLPAMQETQVRSLVWEDALEKEMATHSRTLAWRIRWMEEPGRQQSMGSQRVGHDWVTSFHF